MDVASWCAYDLNAHFLHRGAFILAFKGSMHDRDDSFLFPDQYANPRHALELSESSLGTPWYGVCLLLRKSVLKAKSASYID